MYPFIGIKSIDDLVKNAMLSQTAVLYGEPGAGSSAGNPDLLVTPVSSIKLPGASKKSKRKYPQDILDEAKIMTQGEENLPSWNSP
jgi:hypothetical protein